MRIPGATFSDEDQPEPAGLAKWTTTELQAEIEHRKKTAKEKREAEMKAKEIMVTCPECKGVGTTTQRDWQSGYDESVKCSMCGGNRNIIAHRV